MNRNERRSTRQRNAIIETIQSLGDHPTADRVFFEVRKLLPSISMGTVYRNLGILVEQGLVAELSTPDNVRRYDGNVHRHGHVVCTECGAIADVSPPTGATAEIVNAAESATGYRVDWHRIDLYGVCPKCLANEG